MTNISKKLLGDIEQTYGQLHTQLIQLNNGDPLLATMVLNGIKSTLESLPIKRQYTIWELEVLGELPVTYQSKPTLRRGAKHLK